jgi:hypothetical protein
MPNYRAPTYKKDKPPKVHRLEANNRTPCGMYISIAFTETEEPVTCEKCLGITRQYQKRKKEPI